MNTGDPRATHLTDDCSPEFQPRVDRDQLERTVTEFWSDLQGPNEGSMRLVSGFLIGRRLHGITRRSFSIPAERSAAGSWVAKEASLGRDVYMKQSLARPTGGKAPVFAIGAEVDRNRLAILPGPSISLTVTDTRVQCYWRLDEPISSAEAEKLVKRLMWSQDRPMMLPGMPDNRGLGIGKFDCPECLPLAYSYDDLAQGFPHLKTSEPAWEPGILRPIDLLAQRAGVVTAVFGGGVLRAGLASAAAAVAAIGGFLIPNPLTGEAPVPQSVAASDVSLPGLSEKTNSSQVVSIPSSMVHAAQVSGSQASTPDKPEIKGPLENTKDEGRAQVEQITETDEVGKAIGSGGEVTREIFDASTGAIFERPS